ncbi:RNA polymerase sigma factor [Amycolatopsis aidingensis]|uniref:RNA polymerase sigma factor n=1 Tax=Amycolatopsis aidingensis TaxID=2842453 RepID=UPI001C0B31D1|nr:sigma-70 family RNA polymerase sigma factor [Amycolatopsis aidingensis]
MAEKLERFDRIYRRYYTAVYRFVGRRVASAQVDDMTAEVFVVMWRRLGEMPREDRVLPWLYAVARRVLANETRRVQRARALAEQMADQAELRLGGDHAEAVIDRQLVAAAFDRLDERDQEVLRLVGWEGLSSAEVAAVLGCARTTAVMRISRARRRLLKGLRAQEWHEPAGAPELERTKGTR